MAKSDFAKGFWIGLGAGVALLGLGLAARVIHL